MAITARSADGTIASTWTAEDEALLRAMFAEGAQDAEIGEALGRPMMSVRTKRRALGLSLARIAAPAPPPEWGHARGWARYWTRERVSEALREYAASTRGELPRGTPAWDVITKGRSDLPPSTRVLEYFGAMASAWRELLSPPMFKRRVPKGWVPYTPEEDDFIESHMGRLTMAEIAARLGRGEGAVTMHARRALGMTWTAAREWWSPQEVAEHYGCSVARVRSLIDRGILPAQRGGRVRIDPAHLPGVASDYDERESLQSRQRTPLSRTQREELARLLSAPNAREAARRRRAPQVVTRYADHERRRLAGVA